MEKNSRDKRKICEDEEDDEEEENSPRRNTAQSAKKKKNAREDEVNMKIAGYEFTIRPIATSSEYDTNKILQLAPAKLVEALKSPTLLERQMVTLKNSIDVRHLIHTTAPFKRWLWRT